MVSGNQISSNLASTMDTTSNLACLCPECEISFTEMWMMKEHKRVAHDERVLQCETCNVEVLVKTFKDKHGNELISTLAKIKDLEAFIKQIAEILGIKKPP